MNTVAMNQEAVDRILSRLPETFARNLVVVRTASINSRTGRCMFDFGDGPPKNSVAVAVVYGQDRPTGQFYVIPGGLCPKKLLLRPSSENSKWFRYGCGTGKLIERIQQTAAFRPSVGLLARLA